MFWGFLIFFCHSLFALPKVEIYEDWNPEVSGTFLFERPSCGTSFYYEIRKALEARGYSVCSWDRKAHVPWLLSWRKIQSLQDVKHFLGIDLPRKEVLPSNTAYLILSGVGLHLRELNLNKIEKEKLILFLWEPPTVQPQAWDPKVHRYCHKIYTWCDDLVDGIRFFKFHLPFMTKRQEVIPYQERKFLTLIASRLSSKHPNELYSEREKIIRFFEAHPEESFDLYGRYWAKRKFLCWKGEIPDKMAVLKRYRFAIAYENSQEKGYITEKLWDCFSAGVVPIYLGAPNIAEIVPTDCFIDRRAFSSNEELLEFLKGMPEETWQAYVDRAGEFLKSKEASLYTIEAYAETLANAVSHV